VTIPTRSAGCLILAALGLLALLAPCLAGDRPLLVVYAGGGIGSPASADLLRLVPATGPSVAGPAQPTTAVTWTLLPPIRFDPLSVDLDARLAPPGKDHWLGTDELGRDLLSRLIHSARPSLLVALIATFVSVGLGIPAGAAAGYRGGGVDLALSRLIEASLSFPSLILLLTVAAITLRATGPSRDAEALASLAVVGGAIGLARWGVIARYMRAEVMRLTRSDLAAAPLACGASPARVLALHLVPAGLAPVIVSAAFGAGTAIVAEASLSFLGMGVQPPFPTWGQTMASASLHGARYWWLLVFPGMMVALAVGSFNSIGERLRRRGSGPG